MPTVQKTEAKNSDSATAVIGTVWITAANEQFIMLPPTQLPLGISYCSGQQEICKTSGKKHWQVFYKAAEQHKIAWFRKKMVEGTKKQIMGLSWLVKVVMNNGADIYGLKDDTCFDPATRFEFGDKPERGLQKRQKICTEDLKEQILECKTWSEALGVQGVHSVFAWAQAVWQSKPPKKLNDCPKECYGWQRKIIKWTYGINFDGTERSEYDMERKILILEDPRGRTGKTKISKIMNQKFRKTWWIKDGMAHKDLCNALFNLIELDREPEIIFLDLSKKTKDNYVPSAWLEGLCDGSLCNAKWKSGTFDFKPKQVVVLTNAHINWELEFSADRIELKMLTLPKTVTANLEGQGLALFHSRPWEVYGDWNNVDVWDEIADKSLHGYQDLIDKFSPELPVVELQAAEPEVDAEEEEEIDDWMAEEPVQTPAVNQGTPVVDGDPDDAASGYDSDLNEDMDSSNWCGDDIPGLL